MPHPLKLHIRVPASTSNLGPGFDCVGLALALYDDFTISSLPEGVEVPDPAVGACTRAFDMFVRVAALAERPAPPIVIEYHGAVPAGVGLGSSASGRVAGALAANRMLGEPFGSEQLLAALIEREGHPDNVTPALLGGLTLTAQGGAGPLAVCYEPHPKWRYVLAVPDYRLSTRKMRALLPAKARLEDAVFNMARVPLLIDALVAGDADLLGWACEDRLHQELRAGRVKRFGRMRKAALKAGAAAFFLSGSGPAVAAVCEGEESAHRVLAAILDAAEGARFKLDGHILATEPDGARVAEG